MLAALFLVAGCQREERAPRVDPAVAEALNGVVAMPNGIGGAPPQVYVALGKPYADNAYSLAQGKRLYFSFSCPQCHGDGHGTRAGPSFLDGWWNYGSDITSIVVSIRDGRPHGMPAFLDRLTMEQIWQIAGYIQTVGSYQAKIAAPGRNDAPHTRPAENRAPAAKQP